MELAFQVAGIPLRWRFVGANRLQSTLARRPWENGGGVLLTSVVREVEMERTLQAIAQLVRAYDAAGAVQLSVIPDVPTDPYQALHACAGVAVDVSGRRRLEALARSFDRPRAWILGFERNPAQLADTLKQTLEDVEKVAPADLRLCLPLIVLGHRERGRKGADLSTGFPVDSPYGSAATPRHRLWSVYLHWRVAWFTGGRPGWAEQLGARLCGGLGPEDDQTFEKRLCDAASEAWESQPGERKSAMLRWLARWPAPDVADTRDLADADLLWHPAHDAERGLQPVPWVARAVLMRPTAPPGRSLLRGCDACEPLAVAALSRCLHLEASLKARADVMHGDVGDDAVQRANPSLLTRRRGIRELGLIPSASPTRARRLFDYAGITDLLGFVDGPARELGRRLRDVRNALAHGHPPSWAMTVTIADIWRKLAV